MSDTTGELTNRQIAEAAGLITVDTNGQWTRTEKGRSIFEAAIPDYLHDATAALSLLEGLEWRIDRSRFTNTITCGIYVGEGIYDSIYIRGTNEKFEVAICEAWYAYALNRGGDDGG